MLHEQGKGVSRDFAEAMRWYRQALERKEPHAACRIADLYRDGKGVPRNLAEAAQWYRQEAEGSCSSAQFNLGRICEAQQNLEEALQRYCRAAAGGETAAQIQLGDLLSDGITVAADYIEACQWLLLATQADIKNRLIQAQLRRVKAKLTPEQLEEAQRRADAISKRLDAQKPGRKP